MSLYFKNKMLFGFSEQVLKLKNYDRHNAHSIQTGQIILTLCIPIIYCGLLHSIIQAGNVK